MDPAASMVRFRDTFGNSVQMAEPARRIVVINGDAVEILCAIGAKDNIVGISNHTAKSPYPVGKMTGKTAIGSTMTPSIEKIIECRPDLVIAYEIWMYQKAFEAKLNPLASRWPDCTATESIIWTRKSARSATR